METTSSSTELEKANASLSEMVLALNKEIDVFKQRFVQQDNLANIGNLTAGILHEIKNPLNFITNFSKLSVTICKEVKEISQKIQEGTSPEDIAEMNDLVVILENNLTKIQENGERAERIIFGMLSQTRTNEIAFQPTNINQILEEFAKLAYQGARAEDKDFNVTFSFRFDPAVGLINVAATEFNRVIINLVGNAYYAVNEKRRRFGEKYNPEVFISTERLPQYVVIRIRDNGIGIPPEVRQKLFTPFFTTKPVGKGTGLGLSLSRSIIQEIHKGTLAIDSEPGEFTEVTITLPILV
ncbi:hypothetical protein GCM10023189_46020 [Nibrella saemangeumensis]|uniref:histidine kinase n=1 Tax=Nibrella saemangeumensis TaxID=1084526 RepID=A0ABP8NGE4_9BACT